MNITEATHRKHEELFLNHQSFFDNFAFDEVLAKSKLDTKTRVMMILAALIA